jgi:trehalose-6-phosphate synthase
MSVTESVVMQRTDPTDPHTSSSVDQSVTGLRLHALEMGALVIDQVAGAVRALVESDSALAHLVLAREVRANGRSIARINGRFGQPGVTPVEYIQRSISREALVALYRRADVMMVTPLREGMNLVAHEYVLCQSAPGPPGRWRGALVLSEFAGAADELTDAVLVNPHDDHALQQAIVKAVEMDRHERRDRMAGLRDQIRKSDVQGWADRFLAQLAAAGSPPAP